MSIILCHNSALEYYRNCSDYLSSVYNPAPNFAIPSSTEINEALSTPPVQSDVDELLCRYASTFSNPLHLAIKSNEHRPRRSTAVFHTLPHNITGTTIKKTSTPIGASSLYLCNAPLTLSQLSLNMSHAALAMTAYELCGTYRLSNSLEYATQPGFTKTNPLSSVKSIDAYTRINRSIRGAKTLNTIVRYTCDNSASPMETILAILLCFPTKWGGYGLPKPRINQRVTIPHSAQSITNKHFFVCDMLWPREKLAIEYDSNQFHTGAEHISQDALKRNVLMDLGYTVITVTSDQVFNAIKTHELAKQISKCLGIRFRGTKAEPSSARFSLRNELMGV